MKKLILIIPIIFFLTIIYIYLPEIIRNTKSNIFLAGSFICSSLAMAIIMLKPHKGDKWQKN